MWAVAPELTLVVCFAVPVNYLLVALIARTATSGQWNKLLLCFVYQFQYRSHRIDIHLLMLREARVYYD